MFEEVLSGILIAQRSERYISFEKLNMKLIRDYKNSIN